MKQRLVFYMMAAALAMMVAGCNREDGTDDADDHYYIYPFHLTEDRKNPDKVMAALACPSDFVKGKDDEIVGKWKLLTATDFDIEKQTPDITDYSCEDIVFHFRKDGTAVMESNGAKMDFHYRFHAKFRACPVCDLGSNLVLTIGESGYCFAQGRVVESIMVLAEYEATIEPLQFSGENLVFVRIEK